MKRRKKPLLLVTVLVVLLDAVVVMSMPPGGLSIRPPAGDVTGDGRAAPSSDDVAADLKKHTLPVPKKHVRQETPTGPSIAVEASETGYQKPKPVPGGTTSSQWYTNK